MICVFVWSTCEAYGVGRRVSLRPASVVSSQAARGGGGEIPLDFPCDEMRMGTSGLRKKTAVWCSTPQYTLKFAWSLLLGWCAPHGVKIVLLGGDGREYSAEAGDVLARVLASNGVRVVWCEDPIATPAASAIVRRRKLDGAVLMTASHNPGGADGDFGVKFNTGPDGAPAKEHLTEAVREASIQLSGNASAYIPPESKELADSFETCSSTADYVSLLLGECFDADVVARAIKDRSVLVDAMHGAAGPAASALFKSCLRGLSEGDEDGSERCELARCDPRPDFGGCHPDPNLKWASDLATRAGLDDSGSPLSEGDPEAGVVDFGAALDGDGDRNMIVGAGIFVSPSDSLAVLAARAHKIRWFVERGGLKAVARSMPTSRAVDRVASRLGIPCYETPTGWKFFGNLMEKYSEVGGGFLCGEESFGTGADHIREKDGLWAVLAWLSILEPGESVKDALVKHWQDFGRDLYCRYDFEECDSQKADEFFKHLEQEFDSFEYVDPVDGSVSKNQGIILDFPSTLERAVFRKSGTGSVGATVRLYLERYVPNPTQGDLEAVPTLALSDLADRAITLTRLEQFLGRSATPDVIT